MKHSKLRIDTVRGGCGAVTLDSTAHDCDRLLTVNRQNV
jgi:uncharacterized protein (DUF779 family)